MTNSEITNKIQTVKPLAEFNSILKRLNIPVRFRSAFIDHFAMIFVIVIVCLPLFVFVVYTKMRDGKSPSLEDHLWTSIYASLGPALYFNKDLLLGQSIGKRLCGLQVTNLKTQLRANPYKCVLRNVTLILWPLELIIVLITGNRRLGDFIANTEITPAVESEDIHFPWSQMVTCLLVAIAAFWMIKGLDIL